ncbi:hypothetical protein Btru_022580 [Bulinus truncatus]|nr:hypothetical protein Btru_022580 [Bulinus truncatus]
MLKGLVKKYKIFHLAIDGKPPKWAGGIILDPCSTKSMPAISISGKCFVIVNQNLNWAGALINEALSKHLPFQQAHILGLSQGSVVVDFLVSFHESNVSKNDIVEALKNITFWTTDQNSFSINETNASSSTNVPTTTITVPLSTNQTTDSTEATRTTISSLQPLANATDLSNLTTVASNISTTVSVRNETEAFNMTTTTAYLSNGTEQATHATSNVTHTVTNVTEAYNTTTSSPTNVTDSTTSIYSTTETKLKIFSVSFKITSLNWTEELSNKSSTQYINLTSDLIIKINEALSKHLPFQEAHILGLSQGSVVVDLLVSFHESNISNNDIVETLKNITFWTIDQTSFSIKETNASGTTIVPTTTITVPLSTNQTTDSTEATQPTISSLQPLVNATDLSNLTTVESNISTTVSVRNETEAFNMTTTAAYYPTGMEQTTHATSSVTHTVTNVTEAYNTTTSSPTNVTDSTTSIYSTTETKLKIFSVTFKITSLNWTEELSNKSSTQYINLTSDLIIKINEALSKHLPFIGAHILGLSQGSVVVDLLVSFHESNVSKNDIVEALKNITFWTTDQNSFSINETNASSSTNVPTTTITVPLSTNQTTDSTEATRTTISSQQPLANATDLSNLTTVASNISTTVSVRNETEAFNMTTTTAYLSNGTEQATHATSNVTHTVTNVTEAYNTTTSSPTNVTDSTTSIYSTTETKLKIFSVSFKITSLNWTEELSNKSSTQYINLTSDLIIKIKEALSQFTSFHQATITGLSQGSIVVGSKLIFLWSNISESEIIEALKNISFWNTDPSSFTINEMFASSTTIMPSTSITFPLSSNQTTESTITSTEATVSTISSQQPLINVTELSNHSLANDISTTTSILNITGVLNATTSSAKLTTDWTTNVTEGYSITAQPVTNFTESTFSITTHPSSNVTESTVNITYSTLNVTDLTTISTISSTNLTYVTMTVANTTIADYTQSQSTDNLTEPTTSRSETDVSTQPSTQLTTIPLTPAVVIQGKFTITNGTDWSDQLANMESNEAKALAADIETQLTALFKKVQGFRDVQVKSFSKGSVIVQSLTTFESTDVTADNLTDIMKKHLASNESKLGIYTINLESVEHDEIKATPTDSDKFPDWAIAVIVCGGCLVIFVIVMTVILCCRRSNNRKYNFDEEYMQYRRSWASQDTSNPSQTDDIYDSAGVEHYKQPYKIQEGDNIALSETNQRKPGHEHSNQNTKTGEVNYGYCEPKMFNSTVSKNGDAAHYGINGNGEQKGTMVYREDDTITYHDLQKDAWETRL